jgi:O-antigen ligase
MSVQTSLTRREQVGRSRRGLRRLRGEAHPRRGRPIVQEEAAPPRGLPAAVPTGLNPLILAALCLFAATLFFEDAPLGVPVEVSTLAGAALAGAAFLQPAASFRAPPLAIWGFVGFLYVALVMALMGGETQHQSEVLFKLAQLGGVFFLFWVSASVLHSETARTGALVSLAVAATLLGCLQLSGLAVRAWSDSDGIRRLTAFGFHPNHLAAILGLGLLAAVGLVWGRGAPQPKYAALAVPAFLAIGPAIVQTGSRGGLLALGAGLTAFAGGRGSIGTRVRNVALVLVAVATLAALASQSESTRRRFEGTLARGDVSRRDSVYRIGWAMVQERPLTGWGVVNNTYELGARFREPGNPSKDTHNLLLYLLTGTGVAGTAPFVIGLALCCAAAWRARAGPEGVLPLAFLVALLVTNLGVTWLHCKLQWLLLGYVAASAAPHLLRQARLSRR